MPTARFHHHPKWSESQLRLDELHGVLQAVFGWTDSHLHRFSLGETAWDDAAEHFLCPYDVEEGEDDGVPACVVRLDEVLAEPADSLLYTYDYGDEWNHPSWSSRSADQQTRCCAPAAGGPRRQRTAAASGTGTPTPRRRSTWPRRRQAWRCGRSSGRCHRRSPSCCGTWLVDRVDAGLPLTAARWLPPAVVTEAMDALWPEDRWIGKRNREDLTEPVRRLRASAQRLGLLRVARGRLLLTKASAGLRDDPTRLWQHVAERLAGRPKDAFSRTATSLVLVSAAGGRIDDEQLAAVLTAAGWSGRGGNGVHRYAVRGAAGHVDEVLDLIGAYQERWAVNDAGRVLARAALTSR